MEIKIHSNQIWLSDPSKAHGYDVEVGTDQSNGDTVFVGVDATNRTQAASLAKKSAFKWICGTGHYVASVNMTS